MNYKIYKDFESLIFEYKKKKHVIPIKDIKCFSLYGVSDELFVPMLVGKVSVLVPIKGDETYGTVIFELNKMEKESSTLKKDYKRIIKKHKCYKIDVKDALSVKQQLIDLGITYDDVTLEENYKYDNNDNLLYSKIVYISKDKLNKKKDIKKY